MNQNEHLLHESVRNFRIGQMESINGGSSRGWVKENFQGESVDNSSNGEAMEFPVDYDGYMHTIKIWKHAPGFKGFDGTPTVYINYEIFDPQGNEVRISREWEEGFLDAFDAQHPDFSSRDLPEPEMDMAETNDYLQENTDTMKEVLTENLASRLKEIEAAANMAALESKMSAIAEEIEARTTKATTLSDNEDLKDFLNPEAMKGLRAEIKMLKKRKNMYEKQMAKMQAKMPAQVVDEEKVSVNESQDCGCGCNGSDCDKSSTMLTDIVKHLL